jgi:hypothetical protein
VRVLLFLLFSLLSMGQIAFVAHIVSLFLAPPDRPGRTNLFTGGHQHFNEKAAFPLFCTHCPLSRHELLSTIERSCEELLSGTGGNVLRLIPR